MLRHKALVEVYIGYHKVLVIVSIVLEWIDMIIFKNNFYLLLLYKKTKTNEKGFSGYDTLSLSVVS